MESKFTQLCVWPSTTLGENTVEDLVQFFVDTFDTRIKFEEIVLTLPDKKDGIIVKDTGGRSDIFFYAHTDDLSKFSVPRLNYGIRWWEDVVGNGSHQIYPKEIIDKYQITL